MKFRKLPMTPETMGKINDDVVCGQSPNSAREREREREKQKRRRVAMRKC